MSEGADSLAYGEVLAPDNWLLSRAPPQSHSCFLYLSSSQSEQIIFRMFLSAEFLTLGFRESSPYMMPLRRNGCAKRYSAKAWRRHGNSAALFLLRANLFHRLLAMEGKKPAG